MTNNFEWKSSHRCKNMIFKSIDFEGILCINCIVISRLLINTFSGVCVKNVLSVSYNWGIACLWQFLLTGLRTLRMFDTYRISSTSSVRAAASVSYLDRHVCTSPLARVSWRSRSKRASDSSSSCTLIDSSSISTWCKLASRVVRRFN